MKKNFISKMNKQNVVFLCLILFIPFCFSSCTTRYYLVRHAEKACEECFTCGLTGPGETRAKTLRDTLFKKGIDTIFTSECLRTQLTAKPLADRLQKRISIYQTSQLQGFINTLKGFNNKSILVVGHSNQIPVIVDSLAHRHVVVNAYNNLFVITKKSFLNTTSVDFQSLTYGNP
jgi:2,3-bisphosphoglycerate-dependent phosphoglycerate mutase